MNSASPAVNTGQWESHGLAGVWFNFLQGLLNWLEKTEPKVWQPRSANELWLHQQDSLFRAREILGSCSGAPDRDSGTRCSVCRSKTCLSCQRGRTLDNLEDGEELLVLYILGKGNNTIVSRKQFWHFVGIVCQTVLEGKSTGIQTWLDIVVKPFLPVLKSLATQGETRSKLLKSPPAGQG